MDLQQMINGAPAWDERVRAGIEQRIPGGHWLLTPGDWAAALRTNRVRLRAVLRKGGVPVAYVTPKTANEQASDALRGLVDWAQESKR
jgi:hypothetical protein